MLEVEPFKVAPQGIDCQFHVQNKSDYSVGFCSHRSTIEEREESVRCAIVLLGKAEKILKILDQELLSSSDPEQLACIDNWRSSRKQKNPLQFGFPSTVSGTAAFSSSNIYLSIE